MDEIIKLLMNMGKTKEEALEFVGKDVPAGGIDDVGSNIIRPITKKVAGDYPLIGSKITDPTQQGQFGRYFIQTLDPKDRYNLIRQSIDDQKENWQKTFEFIRTGGYKLSDLQKQNLNYNLGVLQRSKIVLTDITKGLESQKIDVEDLYNSFVKNKRFLGNESTGLSSEGNELLEYINKTKEKIEDLTKTGKKQEDILSQQKKDNDARMKRLYNGRAYEKNDGNYRALGGYHLPKLHEAGIINLDPKIYEAIKKGEYHHGGADFFAPDPNRVLQYHYGTKIFDDLDDAINKAAMDGEVPLKGPDGMIKFLKDNDYLPFRKDGPANALDYLNDVEKLERIKELDSATKTIKSGQSNFYKTPDQIMDRVMQNANDKFQYLDSLKRTHPGKFKLYQKDISEEPFFGVDIGQNDLFSDLSDLSFPKDKGDLLPFPKKEGIKAVDEDKRLLTDDEIIDYEAELGDSETWMMDGTVGEAKKALKDRKDYEAEMFGLYKAGKLDPEAGSVTRARLNFLKNKLEEAELSGDNRLISEDEIFELEGLTKKFRKEDLEFKVQEQPDRKLTDEEIQELKDLTDDDPDFDMAEGGRINFRGGGRYQGGSGAPGSAKSSSRSRSSTNRGPAGGASAGGNYGGNVNPNQTYAGKTQSQRPSNYGGTGPSTKTKTKTKTVTTGGKSPFTYTKTKPKINTNTATYGIDKTLLESLINRNRRFANNDISKFNFETMTGIKPEITLNNMQMAKVYNTQDIEKLLGIKDQKTAEKFVEDPFTSSPRFITREKRTEPRTQIEAMDLFRENLIKEETKYPGKTFDQQRSGALEYGIRPTDRNLIPSDFLNQPGEAATQTPFGNIAAEIEEKYPMADGGIISLRKRR